MYDTDLRPGRPDTDESLPYYVQYIGLVPGGHIVELVERQIAESAAAVRAAFVAFLDVAAWERRAPTDWTIRSVRAVVYVMAGHERHHPADIRRQHGG